jgi:hypothetical protein
MATTPKKQELPALREQRSLLRGVNLRMNANNISPAAFQARKDYIVNAYENGAFLKEPDKKGQAAPNPMTDPAAMEGMMGMMKGNMAMIVPQTLIMGWINAFFSGFVIGEFCCWAACRARLIGDCSPPSIPVNDQVQEHVTGRRSNEGYGSTVDVIYLLVCAVHIWTAIRVQLPAWER